MNYNVNSMSGRTPPYHAETTIKVLGGGGVGEETLLQKGPFPAKHFNVNLPANSIAAQ